MSLILGTNPILFGQERCSKGNCINGYGTFIFADGSKYIGDFGT